MSQQDDTQSSNKQRKSRKVNTADQENSKQALAVERPANDDPEARKAYWQQQGQPWRTEPEIDSERQKYLSHRRKITPNIEQGIYPFKDIEPKLTRADIEWLLATHENGKGPVDWSDESQREREGLDLRAADLSRIDLRELPLACMRGGLIREEWLHTIPEQRNLAGVHLEGTDLRRTHLEGAILMRAHLERAAIRKGYLENVNLSSAYLERATLQGAHLEQANFGGAHLDRVSFVEAHLAGTNFRGARLEGANFFRAHLEGMLKLEKKTPVELPPANLGGAFFDAVSSLAQAILGDEQFGFVTVVDVHWGNVNLAVVNWVSVSMLGDERKAKQRITPDGLVKEKMKRLNEYEQAVRANRQLAVALQEQGLNEQASRFAYRAQKLQRIVLWLQRKPIQYLFSGFLDLLAGYGYKPWRSFLAYLLVITAFATAYFIIGRTSGPSLSPVGAWVFSMTSFHGRGFFPGGIKVDDPLTILAALEAFVGLLIEVTFIATLTQRLFGK